MLEIISFVLGPVQTNAYLVADPEIKQAVVIDPAWDGEKIQEVATRRGWQIIAIWLTHAHFDHIAGAAAIVNLVTPPPIVAIHSGDMPLYRMQGGASLFGMSIDPVPAITNELVHGQNLRLGRFEFQVRHAPGHTPGHVIYYCSTEGVVFCGDVIFQGSIGRTDLPGGSYTQLLDSIENQILDLPENTRLFSGHGPVTTVGEEKSSNPFLG
jgi:glyoxylase-like metal-dependent hydrolase (beta-lactamase superfamily II)